MPKQVVIVVVEGESDEALLVQRLRELYSDHEIRFESQHGDIFYDQDRDQDIKKVVGTALKAVMQKRKFHERDIVAVVHLVDTDGCLIPDDLVSIDTSQTAKTFYTIESIKVSDPEQRRRIIRRNQRRSRDIRIMHGVSHVLGGKIPYQLYYFSRNLEHVIFDEPNPAEERVKAVEDFVCGLEEPLEVFLSRYLPKLEGTDYQSRYRESWRAISIATRSLARGTNVPLLFDFISETIKVKQRQ